MRNLKKVLALVLVFVMSFALVINASAYTYKDQAKIDTRYADAINMMYELKIMQGDTNGNFLPENALRRSELAKMIYVILNRGNTNANAYAVVTGVPFKDFKSTDWYAGYVNWSFIQKLVDGKTPTKFAPIDNVTGYEAAKFILGAMGYRTDIEKYTGSGWSLNVLRDASSAGLLEGIEDIDMNKPLQRQHAAQMLYNGLFNVMVSYTSGDNVVRYPDALDTTMAMKYFGLQTLEGVFVANEWVALGGSAAKTGTITLANANTTAAGVAQNLSVTADPALLGRIVKVFVKGTVDGDGKIKSISKVYGTPILANTDSVFEVSAGDLKTLDSDTAATTCGTITYTKNSTLYSTPTGTSAVDMNSATNGILFVNFVGKTITVANGAGSTDWNGVASGNPITVVYDPNTKVIKYILATNYTFAKIAVSSAGKVTAKNFDTDATIANFNAIDKANIVFGSDLATDGNRVLIASVGDKWRLVAVTKLTGQVTNKIGDKAYIDSVGYEQAKFDGCPTSFTFATDDQGVEKDFYVFGGKLLGASSSAASPATTYAVVYEAQYYVGTGAAISVLKSDNTKASFVGSNVKVLNNNGTARSLDATSAPALKDNMFSYTLSEDGKVITLKDNVSTGIPYGAGNATLDPNLAGVAYTAKASKINLTGALAPAADYYMGPKSIAFVKHTDGWRCYIGVSAMNFALVNAATNWNASFCKVVAKDKTAVDNDTITVASFVSAAAYTPDTTGDTLAVVLTTPSVAQTGSTYTATMKLYVEGKGVIEAKTTKAHGGVDIVAASNINYKAGALLKITGSISADNVLGDYEVQTLTDPVAAGGAAQQNKNVSGYITVNNQVAVLFLAKCVTEGDLPTGFEYTYNSDTKFYSITKDEEGTFAVAAVDRATVATFAEANAKTDTFSTVAITNATGIVTKVFINNTGAAGEGAAW